MYFFIVFIYLLLVKYIYELIIIFNISFSRMYIIIMKCDWNKKKYRSHKFQIAIIKNI